MAILTIRNLDESLKGQLRMRAASRGRSMEEEARQILRAALNDSPPAPSVDLAERIKQRFAPLGGVDLPIAPREAMRAPSVVSEAARQATKKRPAASKQTKTQRRP